MAEILKEIKYDGEKVLVEAAKRDGAGNLIADTYATKEEVNDLVADSLNTQIQEQLEEILEEISGTIGLPEGGEEGQVLVKTEDGYAWGDGSVAANIEASLDNNGEYILTINLKDNDGNIISTDSVDLPLETMVVSGSYSNGIITLTLQNGNEIEIPVGSLIEDLTTSLSALTNRVSAIEGKIPSQATSENQLADKAFVNSSISTNTSNFRGTYIITTDLSLTIEATESAISTALNTAVSTKTNNDYVFVAYPASHSNSGFDKFDRFKFNGTDWNYEFTLNNSSFTSDQWSAINSGITSSLVSKITANETAISGITNGSSINNFSGVESALSGIKNGSSINSFSGVERALGGKQNTIDSEHKLSSDLVDDTDKTNKFVTASEKTQITTNKNDISNIKDGTDIDSFGDVESALSGKQNVIDSDHKLDYSLIDNTPAIPTKTSDITNDSEFATESFVNSSISTNTATFRGTYDVVTDLALLVTTSRSDIAAKLDIVVSTKTNNDYIFISYPSANGSNSNKDKYERYKYNGSAWEYEFTLNNSSFTSDQWNAINSGITSNKVSNYDAHLIDTNNPHGVTKTQIGLGNVDNTSDLDKPVSTATQTALSGKQNTIDSSHKLSSDLIDDTDKTNKFVTASEKSQITTNANAINNIKDGVSIDSFGDVESALSGKQNVIDSDHKLDYSLISGTPSIPTNTSDLTNDGDGNSSFATESFVNSSVSNNTATFRGTYDIITDLSLTASATESAISTALNATVSTKTNNDYVFVAYPTTHSTTNFDKFDRYKYDGTNWNYEFTLNNSTFTDAQWNAINSGITSSLVEKIGTNESAISTINSSSVMTSGIDSTKVAQIATNTSDIGGLSTSKQDKIDSEHKLSSDLVDDADKTNKFVTASEKSQITTNANAISAIKDGTSIDSFGDVETALADKVDKVNGKGLSENDFTDTYKDKVDANETAISGIKNGTSINNFSGVESALATKVDKELGKGLSTNDFTTAYKNQVDTNATNISNLQALVPNQATSSNKLADKDYVNSSIATNTATFRGTKSSIAELNSIEGADNNDYAFVLGTDNLGNAIYSRYKYVEDETNNTAEWVFEYTLNNSSFTADQWASINSNITPALVESLRNISGGQLSTAYSNYAERQGTSSLRVLGVSGFSEINWSEINNLNNLSNGNGKAIVFKIDVNRVDPILEYNNTISFTTQPIFVMNPYTTAYDMASSSEGIKTETYSSSFELDDETKYRIKVKGSYKKGFKEYPTKSVANNDFEWDSEESEYKWNDGKLYVEQGYEEIENTSPDSNTAYYTQGETPISSVGLLYALNMGNNEYRLCADGEVVYSTAANVQDNVTAGWQNVDSEGAYTLDNISPNYNRYVVSSLSLESDWNGVFCGAPAAASSSLEEFDSQVFTNGSTITFDTSIDPTSILESLTYDQDSACYLLTGTLTDTNSDTESVPNLLMAGSMGGAKLIYIRDDLIWANATAAEMMECSAGWQTDILDTNGNYTFDFDDSDTVSIAIDNVSQESGWNGILCGIANSSASSTPFNVIDTTTIFRNGSKIAFDTSTSPLSFLQTLSYDQESGMCVLINATTTSTDPNDTPDSNPLLTAVHMGTVYGLMLGDGEIIWINEEVEPGMGTGWMNLDSSGNYTFDFTNDNTDNIAVDTVNPSEGWNGILCGIPKITSPLIPLSGNLIEDGDKIYFNTDFDIETYLHGLTYDGEGMCDLVSGTRTTNEVSDNTYPDYNIIMAINVPGTGYGLLINEDLIWADSGIAPMAQTTAGWQTGLLDSDSAYTFNLSNGNTISYEVTSTDAANGDLYGSAINENAVEVNNMAPFDNNVFVDGDKVYFDTTANIDTFLAGLTYVSNNLCSLVTVTKYQITYTQVSSLTEWEDGVDYYTREVVDNSNVYTKVDIPKVKSCLNMATGTLNLYYTYSNGEYVLANYLNTFLPGVDYYMSAVDNPTDADVEYLDRSNIDMSDPNSMFLAMPFTSDITGGMKYFIKNGNNYVSANFFKWRTGETYYTKKYDIIDMETTSPESGHAYYEFDNYVYYKTSTLDPIDKSIFEPYQVYDNYNVTKNLYDFSQQNILTNYMWPTENIYIDTYTKVVTYSKSNANPSQTYYGKTSRYDIANIEDFAANTTYFTYDSTDNLYIPVNTSSESYDSSKTYYTHEVEYQALDLQRDFIYDSTTGNSTWIPGVKYYTYNSNDNEYIEVSENDKVSTRNVPSAGSRYYTLDISGSNIKDGISVNSHSLNADRVFVNGGDIDKAYMEKYFKYNEVSFYEWDDRSFYFTYDTPNSKYVKVDTTNSPSTVTTYYELKLNYLPSGQGFGSFNSDYIYYYYGGNKYFEVDTNEPVDPNLTYYYCDPTDSQYFKISYINRFRPDINYYTRSYSLVDKTPDNNKTYYKYCDRGQRSQSGRNNSFEAINNLSSWDNKAAYFERANNNIYVEVSELEPLDSNETYYVLSDGSSSNTFTSITNVFNRMADTKYFKLTQYAVNYASKSSFEYGQPDFSNYEYYVYNTAFLNDKYYSYYTKIEDPSAFDEVLSNPEISSIYIKDYYYDYSGAIVNKPYYLYDNINNTYNAEYTGLLNNNINYYKVSFMDISTDELLLGPQDNTMYFALDTNGDIVKYAYNMNGTKVDFQFEQVYLSVDYGKILGFDFGETTTQIFTLLDAPYGDDVEKNYLGVALPVINDDVSMELSMGDLVEQSEMGDSHSYINVSRKLPDGSWSDSIISRGKIYQKVTDEYPIYGKDYFVISTSSMPSSGNSLWTWSANKTYYEVIISNSLDKSTLSSIDNNNNNTYYIKLKDSYSDNYSTIMLSYSEILDYTHNGTPLSYYINDGDYANDDNVIIYKLYGFKKVDTSLLENMEPIAGKLYVNNYSSDYIYPYKACVDFDLSWAEDTEYYTYDESTGEYTQVDTTIVTTPDPDTQYYTCNTTWTEQNNLTEWAANTTYYQQSLDYSDGDGPHYSYTQIDTQNEYPLPYTFGYTYYGNDSSFYENSNELDLFLEQADEIFSAQDLENGIANGTVYYASVIDPDNSDRNMYRIATTSDVGSAVIYKPKYNWSTETRNIYEIGDDNGTTTYTLVDVTDPSFIPKWSNMTAIYRVQTNDLDFSSHSHYYKKEVDSGTGDDVYVEIQNPAPEISDYYYMSDLTYIQDVYTRTDTYEEVHFGQFVEGVDYYTRENDSLDYDVKVSYFVMN